MIRIARIFVTQPSSAAACVFIATRRGLASTSQSCAGSSSGFGAEDDFNSVPGFEAESAGGETDGKGADGKANCRLSLYKANKAGSGAACQFSYSAASKMLFVEASKQLGAKLAPGAGGKQFDWANKLTMKLSLQEIGGLLAVLNGASKDASFVHRFAPKASPASVMQSSLSLRHMPPAAASTSQAAAAAAASQVAPRARFAINMQKSAASTPGGAGGGGGGGPVVGLGLYIELGEAEVLKVFLERSAGHMMGFV